jgi:hypothetical protein
MKTLFAILMSVTLISCSKENTADTITEAYPFQFKGLLKKQEVTSYMYGTHTITSDTKMYALKSTIVNLDTYINKTVTVKGNKINGYPVDGGPEFIDVKEVE